tara:strand:+ start:3475 stop:3888 length:414 start_codon:yes stop_codon:yes gene_type:complete
MTISTRTTRQTATRKRVKFSTKASKPMAESWTEEQYEQELMVYLERKQLLKDMQDELKGRQANLIQYMEVKDIQAAALDDQQVVVCRRKVWKYSDELRRETNRISHLQRVEQGNGTATFTESVYLTVKATSNSEVEE